MDNRRFDSLVKTLSSGDSRRGVLRTLGGGTLAAVFGRLGLAEEAEAKKKRKNKKKKKCKGNTTKCGKKACCRADQICEGGRCVDDIIEVPECLDDVDCGPNEVCQNGTCVFQGECQSADECADNELCINNACRCAFPNKPCGEACCPENQVCFNGKCVAGEGTCAATDDVCVAGFSLTCDDNPNCFCGQRPDGGVHCFGGFLNDSRDNCTCIDDADCERDFDEVGLVCIKGGSACQCQDTDSGRCARLCPTL
jgi:hypothetical protein